MNSFDNSAITVLETSDREQVSSCSLVLSAMEINHTITESNTNYGIKVAEHEAQKAKYHIEAYLAENEGWPPQTSTYEETSSGIHPPTIMLIGALMLFYSVTGGWDSQSTWFYLGRGDSTAIINSGQYFRLVTALTLHADLTHLLSNCFIGAFLIHFFCRTVGYGLGIAAILSAAIMGNAINVFLRGENHLFIGFSTAVFATIGLLVMTSYHNNRKRARYHLLKPFMGGIALLAMLGSSGERTDLGAHLFGLASGIIIGWALISDFFWKLKNSAAWQCLFFLIAIFVVYQSWAIALAKVY